MSALLALALLAAPLRLDAELGGQRGAIVAVDVATGEVVGLGGGVLLARAFPVGSVMKTVTAAAALEAGATLAAYRCPGQPACHGPAHGEVGLEDAIAVSCNAYFAALAARVGTSAIVRAARAFGFGVPTGYLEAEEPGGADATVEQGRAVGIGLDDGLRATPLQVARLAAALATGRLLRLHEGDAPFAATPLGLAPALPRVRDGMRRACMPGGTAEALAELPFPVAGKTGTAVEHGGFRTHAWFAGYAPADAPRYAVAVFVLHGQGAKDAVPVAARVLSRLLGREARR